MRHFKSVVASLALALAFVQAPSSHVHAHESTEGHTGAFFHSHLPHVEAMSSEQAEWRDLDPDHDALFLSWLLTNPTQWRPAPVILVAGQTIVPLLEVTEWRTVTLRPSAHDPPDLDSTTVRPPPA